MDTSIWGERAIFEPFAESVNLSEDCFGTTAMLDLYKPTLTLAEFRAKFPTYNFREGEHIDSLNVKQIITIWK